MPFAAAHFSRLLTERLHYPVTVGRLALTGTTLSLELISVGDSSPAGVPLASCRTVSLSPDLPAMMRGKRSLAKLKIGGLRVNAAKNQQGRWNFEPLAQRLSGQKGKGEIAIRRLLVADSSIKIQGVRLGNLSLDLRELSTSGTSDARFLLTGTDSKGNPLRVEGFARPGVASSAEFTVSAPSLALDALGLHLPSDSPAVISGSTIAIFLAVRLRDGAGTAEGKIGIQGAALRTGGGTFPLYGQLAFNGEYVSAHDSASLSASLNLNEVVRMRATGALREVRGTRSFVANLSIAPMSLASVHDLLPQELLGNLKISGNLGEGILRLKGDAVHGVTEGKGSVALRGGGTGQGEASAGE